MALRPTATKTKQQKKIMNDIRRKERDRYAKKKQTYRAKESQAAGAAAKTAAEHNDPVKIKKRITEQYGDTLIQELRNRLASAVTVDKQLLVHRPPVDLRTMYEIVSPIGVKAFTDFRTISIHVDRDRLPSAYDTKATRDFMFAVKGLFHHEAGHIIHTWPLWDMWKEATPKVLQRADDLGVRDYPQLQQLWNCIEDQRMETARVRDFPTARVYFDHMMGSFLIKDRDQKWWEFSAWALLGGRAYLPEAIRGYARQQFKYDADEWERLVKAYKAADNSEDLMLALLDCYEFMQKNGESAPDGVDSHDPNGIAVKGQEKAADSATGEGGGSGSGEGAGTPDDDPDQITAGAGSGGAHFTKKAMTDAVLQLTGQELPAVDKNTLAAAMDAAGSPGLRPYTGQTEAMNGQEVGKAVALANGIEQALETYVTRATPHWQHRTEEGVLDPCAYRTRESGDTDYNMGMAGEQGEVLDLHVSVLADVSYSMSSHMRQLSVNMLGMKMACDTLHIPSNFTIWSDGDQNFAIYEDGPEEVVFPSLGGTNPTDALNDAVLRNEENRPNHLFLIFTDGAWYGVDSVAPWRSSVEQQFIVVKWGQGPQQVHGADALVNLPSLDAFPDLLRDSLDNMLDSVV